MEEDIKILEKYTEKDIPCDSCRYCTERPKVSKAVRNLIAKYKELEVINKMQEYRISVIDERELIPKSKIKDKIEELKKKVEELTDEKGYWGGSDLLEQIKVLEEILEKEQ